MTVVVADLQDPAKTNPSQVAGIADCLNNYNDAQCSANVDYAHCESGGSFDFTGCNVAKLGVKLKIK